MVVKKGTKEYAAAVAAYKKYRADQSAQTNAMQQAAMQPVKAGPISGPANANPGGLATSVGQADPLANTLAQLLSKSNVKGAEPGPSDLKKFINGGMDAGSRILDVLSRGTYASANTAQEIVGTGGGDSKTTAKGIMRAAWRGLSGKDKTTYKDVLAIGEKATKGQAVAGFALDVALDPTTYIGAGAVKGAVKLGAKGAEKAGIKQAGKVVEFVDKGKNKRLAEEAALAERNTVKPSDIKIDTRSDAFAPPKATTSLRLPDHMESLGPTKAPEVFNPVVAKPTKIANTAPTRAPVLNTELPEMILPKKERVKNEARAKGINAAIGELGRIKGEIEKVRPARYAPDTKVPAPFKTVETTAKAIDKADPERLAYRVAVLSDDNFPVTRMPNGKVIRVGELKKYVAQATAKGDEAALKNINDALDKAVDAALKTPHIRAHLDRIPVNTADTNTPGAISIFDSAGKPMGSHTPEALKRLLSGEDTLKRGMKVDDAKFGIDPTDIANFHVKGAAGGELKPIQNLLDQAQGITRGPDGKVIKAGGKTKTTSRLSADEMAKWMDDAAKVMDPADLGPVMNAKTPAEFDKAIAKIVKETKAKEFDPPLGLKTQLDNAEAALKRAQEEPEWLDKLVEAKTPEGIAAVNAAAAVKSAEEIVEEVAEKGPAIFDRPVAELTAEQSEVVEEALKHFISRDMIAPLLGKDQGGEYVFKSRGGTKRTADKFNEGLGRNVRQFNEFSQGATVAKVILSNAAKMLTPAERGLSDAARGAAIRKYAEPMMTAAWNALDAKGIKSIGGLDNEGIALALPDVLRQFPDDIVNRYFYDMDRQILPSVWVRIAKIMIDHPGDTAGIRKMVESAVKSKVGRSGGGIDNPIVARSGRANQASMRKAQANARKAGKSFDENAEFQGLVTNRVAKVVDAMTSPEVIAKVTEANAISSARYAVVSGAKITSIEQRVLDVIKEGMEDVNVSPAELIRRLSDTSTTAVATAREVGANADELAKARANVKTHIDEILPKDDLVEVKAAARATEELKPENWGKGSFQSPRQAEKFKTIETRRAATTRGLEQTKQVEDKFLDIDDALTGRLHNRMARIYFGVGSKFNTHLGASTLRPEEWANQNMYMGLARDFNNRLSGLHDTIQKQFGPDSRIKTVEAFKAFQTGGEVDAATRPLVEELSRLANFMDGVAERGGFRAEDLNDFMDKNGIKKHTFKPFTEQSAMDQFKAFQDIEDPLDFMSKIQKSMGDASTYVAVADAFSSLGSKSPGSGLVRVINRAGDSRIYAMIDKDLYYPRELVSQLAVMRKMEEQMDLFSRGDNWPVMRLFDKITRGWKTGMTVIRPGHHARNLFSDVVLTGLDGVTDPRAYQAATRILAKHKGNIKGDEELTYMSSLVSELPDDIKGAVNTRVGKQDVSDDAMYNLAFRQGLFPGYQLLEDLTYGATSKTGIPGIKQMVEVGGRVSEWESNYTRMAHFVGAIKQEAKKIKTAGLTDRQVLELAAKRAGDRVKQYHPDGSDLTGLERGVMRRASMFYSWNRKAIPLIAQTALMNPGKVMILPKANYNLAVGMGLDPESLSNPFPDDQLFPDYITASLTGPQFRLGGKYFRMEPGDPFADTVEQWAGGTEDGPTAALSAAATLNPIFRIPLELMIHTKFQSATPIMDKSDYVDSQIPGINTLASLTNRSISALWQAKSGNVLGYNNEGQRVEDETPGVNPLTAINWMTGLGIQNLSKPNMIKNGEYDFRDAVVKANDAARQRAGMPIA